MPIKIVRTKADLQTQLNAWRKAGETIALVPTMGALHHGHLSLVELVQKSATKVVATIFINPKQFGKGEDLSGYPRNEKADVEAFERQGVDLVYVPEVTEIYPNGFQTTVSVNAMGMQDVLCGSNRPGHFDGVATIVTKLLLQVRPHVSVFGEKDYQQLKIIRHLNKDLDIDVKIIGAPIIREDDGLASSSRNRYLTTQERIDAVHLSVTMDRIIERAKGGENLRELEKKGKAALLEAGFSQVDYIEFRHETDLSLANDLNTPTRLFLAAVMGKARLLDNKTI
jgi:pantoate--beta-alanine ligase